MRKSVIALLLALSLLLPAAPAARAQGPEDSAQPPETAAGAENPDGEPPAEDAETEAEEEEEIEEGRLFLDVPLAHWANEDLLRAVNYGIIFGDGNGVFGLGQGLSRGAYLLMLCRVMGWQMLYPQQGSFADNQDPAAWYYAAVETAHAHGVLAGFETYCRPDEIITRAEMAILPVRALGYATLANLIMGDCPFDDVWSDLGYITLASRMGFVKGVDGTRFEPGALCTREQAAAALGRLCDRLYSREVVLREAGPDDVPETAVYAESVMGVTGSIPMSPRAPLSEVYMAASEAGPGGEIALHTAPYAQRIMDGEFAPGGEITAETLVTLLASPNTQTHHTALYESSYLIHRDADGVLTVVWYESQDDIAAKAELCRLLGVRAMYLSK